MKQLTSRRMPKSVYQARPIKRKRRTRAQVDQLDRQIVDALDQDHPQSVRHLFYLMTNPRLPEPVEKSEKGYAQVQHRTVVLRRNDRVPYSWITDATRRGYFTNTYIDAADFIRSVKALYRADLWMESDYYCEVWCESRSIAGVIEDDCRELAVSLYPAGGFTSLSLAYQASGYIKSEHRERDVVILYVGDYDPAGVLIDQKIEEELRRHLPGDIRLEFVRVGVTPDQIRDFDLPTKPRKQADKRAPHITETVEAEAMPAGLLRQLLRSRIETLLPPMALEVAREAEAAEMRVLDMFAEGWKP